MTRQIAEAVYSVSHHQFTAPEDHTFHGGSGFSSVPSPTRARPADSVWTSGQASAGARPPPTVPSTKPVAVAASLPSPRRPPGNCVCFVGFVQYLSNGRFRNADHQAVVNGESSGLSIATFQNPAPDARVWPLAVREGEEETILVEPITFTEMYRRKMERDLDIAKRKKQAKADQLKQMQMQQEAVAVSPKPDTTKSLYEILA